MIEIIQYPSDLLRRKGKYVQNVGEVQDEINEMLATLEKQENCAGLAATQLTLTDPHKIIVFSLPDYNGKEDEPWGLVNPVILNKEGEQKGKEGCMSILNVRAEVIRAKKIEVKGFDLKGNPLHFFASDFLARCIQHEVDHLSGIVYLDYLSPKERRRLERELYAQTKDGKNS